MMPPSTQRSPRHLAPGPFGRILIGSVESEEGADARALGVELAALCHANVVLVDVIEAIWLERIGEPTGTAAVGHAERERAVTALERAADQASHALDRHRVDLRLEVSSSPTRGLHDAAISQHADLIVVGSSHRGPIGRVHPGAVAERLLTSAPCAVAIAPRGHATKPARAVRKVLAAIDGSPEAKLALHAADQLATHAGAALKVVIVVVPCSPGVAVGEALPLPSLDMITPQSAAERVESIQLAEALRRQQSAARATLEAATAELRAGARVEPQLLVGPDAATMILQAARDHTDLLVLGSRAYGPLRRALLGSVSTHLVRNAPCPVLVLPRPPQ